MAKIERTKNAGRNIVFGVILKIYQIIVPFIMRTVMLYYLGEQYLGLNSLFTSILQVLNLAELGVGSAMVYSMYKPIAVNDRETICSLMSLYRLYYRCIGGIIMIVGVMLTPLIPNLIKDGVPDGINVIILYWMNLGATVLTYWLFAYKNALLNAHQRDDVASKVSIIITTFQYAIQLIVLIFLKDYYLYVLMMLVTQAITNIVTAIVVNRMYPDYKPEGKLSRGKMKQINGRIKDLFTAKLGGTLISSGDSIVISAFLGLTPLAIYQNYNYIMKSVISIVLIIFGACTAGIGNSLIIESKEKNYQDFKKFNLLIAWISTIAISCFLCLFQPFIVLWTGDEKYLLSFGCVVIFCIYFHLFILQQLSATYKDAGGLWHSDRFRPFCSALLNLILNILFIRYMGVYAVLLATIISYLFVAMPWLTHNLFTLMFERSPKEYIIDNIKYVLEIAFSASLCSVVSIFTPEYGMVTLIVRFIICVTLSNLIFIMVFRKKKEFILLIELMDRLTHNRLKNITKYLQ